MKKKDAVLKDFVRSLPEDDIRYVCYRLAERKSGDVGEVVEFLQQYPELDRILAGARDANDLYDLVDETQEYFEREASRRYS